MTALPLRLEYWKVGNITNALPVEFLHITVVMVHFSMGTPSLFIWIA